LNKVRFAVKDLLDRLTDSEIIKMRAYFFINAEEWTVKQIERDKNKITFQNNAGKLIGFREHDSIYINEGDLIRITEARTMKKEDDKSIVTSIGITTDDGTIELTYLIFDNGDVNISMSDTKGNSLIKAFSKEKFRALHQKLYAAFDFIGGYDA
jgi:hypothetical protein